MCGGRLGVPLGLEVSAEGPANSWKLSDRRNQSQVPQGPSAPPHTTRYLPALQGHRGGGWACASAPGRTVRLSGTHPKSVLYPFLTSRILSMFGAVIYLAPK